MHDRCKMRKESIVYVCVYVCTFTQSLFYILCIPSFPQQIIQQFLATPQGPQHTQPCSLHNSAVTSVDKPCWFMQIPLIRPSDQVESIGIVMDSNTSVTAFMLVPYNHSTCTSSAYNELL